MGNLHFAHGQFQLGPTALQKQTLWSRLTHYEPGVVEVGFVVGEGGAGGGIDHLAAGGEGDGVARGGIPLHSGGVAGIDVGLALGHEADLET